jgi:hypothetical protein
VIRAQAILPANCRKTVEPRQRFGLTSLRNLVEKVFSMGRLGRLVCGSLVTVGMVVSFSGARGETGQGFHIACTVAETSDKARATAICEEFIAVAKAQPDLAVTSDLPAPLAVGPGLEVRVDKVNDTQLQLTPTWIGAEGQRATQPSVGVRMMDKNLTENRRRDLYLRLLSDFPK